MKVSLAIVFAPCTIALMSIRFSIDPLFRNY
jgi:hypothetical protein